MIIMIIDQDFINRPLLYNQPIIKGTEVRKDRFHICVFQMELHILQIVFKNLKSIQVIDPQELSFE